MTSLALKWLHKDGFACHGGSGQWRLPAAGAPGAWMPEITNPKPCERGYHLCRLPPSTDALSWCAPALWIAEYGGGMIESGDKIVVSRARLLVPVEGWTARTARLFACDCAERVLHIFERKHPNDSRVRNAIEIARSVANGNLPADRLVTAWAKAATAGWGAAWITAANAARDAAGAAACSAARNAAAAAAGGLPAAGAAEAQWQIARFAEIVGLVDSLAAARLIIN